MVGAPGILVFLHVIADVVWVGSAIAIAVVIESGMAAPDVLGRVALRVHQRLTTPAFGVALAAGGVRLAMDAGLYFGHTKFMHAKLFLALVVIGLDHSIRGRAKRMASGITKEPDGAGRLAALVLLAAAGVVFLAVTKPF